MRRGKKVGRSKGRGKRVVDNFFLFPTLKRKLAGLILPKDEYYKN